MVPQEARCCSWARRRWILPRRSHFPNYDYPSASRSRFWLDVAYLCIPDTGTAHLRQPHGSLPDSTNAAPIRRDGIHPSPLYTQFRTSNGGSLLLLLLVNLYHDCFHQLTITGGMFIPFTFIVEEAQAHGMSPRLAQYLVPILNAARSVFHYQAVSCCSLTSPSIIGRTVPNIVADKVGRFNVMIVMSGFTTILILALWLPATGNAANIVFAAFFGIASGAGIGLTPALAAQVSPIQEIGIRSGTIFSIAAFAALTGSPIGGQIIVVTHGTFKYAVVFGGVSCAVGTALFIWTRIAYGGLKWVKI